MKLSESNKQVMAAFFEARSLISGSVKKSAVNKAFDKTGNTLYADLGSVFKSIGPALSANALIIIQNASMVDGNLVEVDTVLMHESGESITWVSRVPLAKIDAQGFGSAFTYARRYSTMGIFGLVPADDDGNASRKTAKDVTKAMDKSEDLPAMDKVLEHAKQYFSRDSASLRVIQSHYDKRKADMQADSAVGFNPLKPAQKATAQQPSAPVGEDLNPIDEF